MKPHLVERPLPGADSAAKEASTRRVRINLRESAVSWLHARGRLDDRQFAAAELLRRDYERSAIGARTTMDWSASPMGRMRRGAPDPAAPTRAQIDAKRRYLAALDVAGPGLSDIAWRVAGACGSLQESERALGWPPRSGGLVLSLALDRIAAYYRLP